jgi:hypothetical protein
VAFGLEPVSRGATAITRAEPLRDDPFGPDRLHLLEQLGAAPGHVIQVDKTGTTGAIEGVPEQCLPILDRAAAQVVAVQVQ